MLFMHGRGNTKAREAVRLYRICFLRRSLPGRRTFQRLQSHITQTGLLRMTRYRSIMDHEITKTSRGNLGGSGQPAREKHEINSSRARGPPFNGMACVAWGKVTPLPSPAVSGFIDNWFSKTCNIFILVLDTEHAVNPICSIYPVHWWSYIHVWCRI